jgi:rhodanese-related sulfurtransferase
MIRIFTSETVYRFMRWSLGVVFLYAGGSKLLDPQAFAVLIDSYGILPDLLVMPAAIGLPLLEVIAAVGLMTDIRGSLTAIGALLVVFMAILGYGIWMGLDVDCGCFGPEDPESLAYHGLRPALYRDFVMLAGVLYLYVWRFCRRKSPHKLLEVISFIRKGDVAMGKGMVWVLAGIGLILGGYGLAFAADKFEEEFNWEKISIGLCNQAKSGGYQLVGTDELKSWIDAKKDMVLIDTMPYEDSYKKEHVPGAKQFLFPIPDMKAWDNKETAGKSEQDFLQMLGPDKNKLIVIYCGFVKCTRSHNGAMWAVKNGYTNVYRYPGGIFAWKGAKYPVAEVK